ncbi:Secologanin synthase [Hordeum vulgare]|nr:Secologanin synthase [Hordeum vulgare]
MARRTCMSWYGLYPKVTIHDPDLAKEVLSNKFGHFEKLKFPPLSRLIAADLAEHEGEKWVKHRRILNPAFHLEKLKLMLPALSTCCEELVNRWTRSLGSDGTYELDVFPEFQRLTGDAISRTAFGSNYLEGARVFQLQSEQIERMVAGAMKIVLPGYLSLPSKNNRMMHQINSEIESILHGLIRKRMQAMQEGENTKNDVLGLMLESNMRTSGDNGQSISGMTIKEVVTMILYEVLRLYSPAVAFFRKTYKEIKIGSITYPAGVLIELPLLLMNHDPDIWGRDVHEFKPERFTNGISQASKNPGAFLPFSWGPRICIAQQFALLEAKVPFCMILQSFKFELATSYTHVVDNIRLMRPMHGAQINLRWDSDFV